MAVTVFPAPSGGGSGFGEVASRTVVALAANTNKIVKISDLGGAGTYRISFYTNDASAASTVSIAESSSTFGGLTSFTMVSIPNTERSYKFFTTNASTYFLTFNASEEGFIIADKLTQLESPPINITAYTSSQSITLTSNSVVALVGGGGGGGNGNGGAATGGGSGRLTTFSATPGTYSLVVGAGGAGGADGGSTTMNGYTATGGTRGNAGGNGGSGGGGGSWYYPGQIGGSNGNGGGNSPGGNGSGVQFVGFYSYGNGGGGGPYGSSGGGGGGGTYAGGGGATLANDYNSAGGGGGSGVGGGGGGGAYYAGGGTGASGGAIVAEGV